MLRYSFVYCLFLILFSCVCYPLSAQENIVQRLQQQLTNMRPDSSRVDTLYELAYTYNTFDPVKGLAKAKEAFDLAKKNKLLERADQGIVGGSEFLPYHRQF